MCGDRVRVAAGEARQAVIVAIPANRAHQAINAYVTKRVCSNVRCHCFLVESIGDELVAISHIDAEEARLPDWWRGDANVNLGGIRVAQQGDNRSQSIPAHDTVVDKHDPTSVKW